VSAIQADTDDYRERLYPKKWNAVHAKYEILPVENDELH
jgi:hypothetical protein